MSAIQLSSIIFGAMGLPNQSEAMRTRLIHCAIDHGITSFDTAPLYGAGESERILGRALAGCRNRVQILTKCGLRWDSDHGEPMFRMRVDGRMCMVRKDSRPASVRQGLEASLRYLNTDVIDLFQVHHLDAATPLEETMGELERAVAAGKIRAIGVSNYPVPELQRAHAALSRGLFSTQDGFSVLQPSATLAPARTAGVAFLAYEPLARGILAGKYVRDAKLGRTAPRGIERVNSVVRGVALPLAHEHGLTLAQLSLAWALAQPGVTAAIAGASSEQQVLENAAAVRARVEAAAVARLGEAFRTCGFDPEMQGSLVRRFRVRARRLKHATRRRFTAWLGRKT